MIYRGFRIEKANPIQGATSAFYGGYPPPQYKVSFYKIIKDGKIIDRALTMKVAKFRVRELLK